MPTVYHAHDLLDLLVAANGSMALDKLPGEVERRFGTDVRFTNCTGLHYTLEEILEFLHSRGKISINLDEIRVFQQEICQH